MTWQPDPYRGAIAYPPPPRSSSRRWIIIGVVAAVAVVVGLVALTTWGMTLVEDEACTALKKHPAVTGAIGPVDECSMDLGASLGDQRNDYFHYRCRGSKGSGVAIIHTEGTGPNGEEELVGGQLVLADGKKIELKP